jgi:hypothetical protein
MIVIHDENDQAMTVKMRSDHALAIFTVRFTVKKSCLNTAETCRLDSAGNY